MAHFFTECRGSRGATSRLGGQGSGVRAIVASWEGAVNAYAYHHDGVDYVRLSFTTWHGAGTDRLIYDGPISGKKRAKVK